MTKKHHVALALLAGTWLNGVQAVVAAKIAETAYKPMADTVTTAHAQMSEVLIYETPPINVTAQGYAKETLRTPSDTTVYTAEDLKRTGAHDVISALKFKNGVYFTNMGPDGQTWITGNAGVNLRGIENGTLVLVDGIPASFNNVSHLDMVSLDAVDRVEVVKGGGSVLYGSEAFGGVVHVITKKRYENSVRIAAGDRGQRAYTATIDLDRGGLSLSQTHHGATGNLSDVMGTLTINGTSTPYRIGFGKSRKDHIHLTYNPSDALRFSYMYGGKNHTIEYNDASERLLKVFRYDDDEHFANLHYHDDQGWSANTYYNFRSIANPDYFIVNPSVVEWEKSHHRIFGTDVKKVWKDEVSTTLVSISAKRQTYVNRNQKYKNASNSTSTIRPYAKFGAYGMNAYALTASYDRDLSPVTTAILSMRQDRVTSSAGDYHAYLPQLQVMTHLNRESAVYANVGRFFRMPTFRNLYYASAIIVPNPNLRPEFGWNYEVGYKYDRKGCQFTASVFHTDVQDQIVSIHNGGISYQTNAASYRNTGVEVSYVQDENEHLSFHAGMTYGNPMRKYKAGQDWVRALGRYQLTAGINYENRALSTSLNLSFWGDRGYNSTSKELVRYTPIPGNLLTSNLHIAYRFTPNCTATFDAENLCNRRDYTNSGRYYTTGRSFLIGVNYTF